MAGRSKSPKAGVVADGEIVNLNVGGQRFSTSRQTLTAIPDTFFSSLLSGRISSQCDETGAIFIDRDPQLFRIILNFLRNRFLTLQSPTESEYRALLHEAEYYGISPLIKQLMLCNELETSGCGDVLFYSFLPPPLIPSLPANPEKRGSTTTVKVRTGGLVGTAATDGMIDPLKVQMVRAHQNSIAVAYPHFVACYKLRETVGFQLSFSSPNIGHFIERVAINAKMNTAPISSSGGETINTMIAVSYGTFVRLMGFSEEGSRLDVGTFNLHVSVDNLFFIGTQLVALSRTGNIGVWNSMTRHWQSQELSAPITSHDIAGSQLLIGSSNGVISYIDMQKFPLRMKDNDLLVTELYRDPSSFHGGYPEAITAISVYLTPKTSVSGNWIEIAYGTSSGIVRVIVHHPETVGHGPQLFQTFTVHRSPVTKVKLSEELLVSVCAEDNHVRTWGVTRFRGMISTQPGSTSISSFKIMSLEEADPVLRARASSSTDCGPFGEQDDQQVFIQRVVPETDCLYVRAASNGKRICIIKSVDGTTVTSFCVHECEGSSRVGSRSRRFIITGHSSGAIQMWDLTTALEFFSKNESTESKNSGGGPTCEELVKMISDCELSNSTAPTPCCISPSSSTYLGAAGNVSSSQTTRVIINQDPSS